MVSNNNFWKRVDAGDVSNNPYFKTQSEESTRTNQTPPYTQSDFKSGNILGEYIIMPQTSTYAKGVEQLYTNLKARPNAHPTFIKPDNSKIYRPLSFKENIEARVNEYNTDLNSDEQKLALFNTWIDSCTAIAYNKGSTKFKIIPIYDDLINIKANSTANFLPIDYSKISGIELDSSNAKYNNLLSESEIITHPAWIEALEKDKTLLKEYRDITFNILKKNNPNVANAMGFYVKQNTTTDELRALYVRNVGNNSNASGNNILNDNARFLLVAPKKKFT